jgi:hypothetical protein
MNTISPVNSFSPDRVRLLCKRHLVINKKTWGIGFGAVFGLLAFLWYYPALTSETPWHGHQMTGIFAAGIFFYTVGGLFLTSFMFDELHSPSTAFLNLTMPATALEKLTAAWLVSALLFTVVSFAAYMVLTIILYISANVLFTVNMQYSSFSPAGEELLKNLITYLTYHSLFLLGAVYFRKNNFLKTLLSLITFAITLFIILTVGMFLIGQGRGSFHLNLNEVSQTIGYLISLVIISGALFASYIRLKNRQVA